ncbi:pyrimidodiazepine synthase-like [Mya arenaria]|uniref:pyrimidodiazepine synthase-like n=1 Tax=Mya arenaria TaxID=6604 RepID=UPI0022E013FB|nr:pyrimidodiazepine synthase-like [Mya arenaria]
MFEFLFRIYTIATYLPFFIKNWRLFKMLQPHLSKGVEYPELAPGKMRLYSMQICPYAQRTKMVLLHKGLEHETVFIHLRNKPDWYVEKINPLGEVPAIELDGRVVYDSLIVNDYLDAKYPDNRLNPEDPYQLAQDRMLLERYGGVIKMFYKIFFNFCEDKESVEQTLEALDKFEVEVKKRKTPYLGGEKPMMIDFNVWPHLMRIPLIFYAFVPEVTLDADRYPSLTSWMNKMEELPVVKETNIEKDMYKMFLYNMQLKKITQ